MIWTCVRVTSGGTANYRRDGRGNLIVEGVPGGMVIYQPCKPFRTNEQLLIYPTADGGWSAQLTGTEGKDVTDRLPPERWEELFSIAQAAQAFLGSVAKLPDQEIF